MKKNISILHSVAILALAIVALNLLPMVGCSQSALADDAGWTTIFNGKDLSGWDGDPRLWSVKDGVIHGETTQENPARGNTFIVWKGGNLKDFELKIKFRLQNGNSGIQYRSKLISKETDANRWVISGYQAEVENNPGKVGFLYHEAGRAWLVNVGDLMVIEKGNKQTVVSKVSDVEELKRIGYYKDKDWNEYHIIARGNHLIHYLNGYKTMELIDNDRITNPDDPGDRNGSIREGVLALQIHAGPPMIVDFKDIKIKKLEPGKYGDAQMVFNGKDLDNWKGGSGKANLWVVGKAKVSFADPKKLENAGGEGEMINLTPAHGESQDLHCNEKFGDCLVEVQVMVPKGSNSGVYVMGEYEVQVLDSWGKPDNSMSAGDMGAVYGGFKPPFNASRKPGQWQQYVIEWQAPKFDASGKKKPDGKAVFRKIELNGRVLQSNLEMEQQTPGGVNGKEAPTGPLMFQGNHGPVAYRNIIVTPLKK